MLQQTEVEPWQVSFKTLLGKFMTINTQPSATVSKVLYEVYDHDARPVNQSRLIYGEKQLKPDRLLAEYDVQKDPTLHLVLRLSGGVDV